MGRSRRESVTIGQRRQLVADLYLQGWTQSAVAKHLGVSQPTIANDLKAIQTEWRESGIRDFDLARQMELRRLDRVEREAWAAWERSQKPAQSATISTDGADQRTQKTVKDQFGDPRFLEIVHKCCASRRALLGLDAPAKIAPTSPDGEQPYHSYVMAELMRLSEQAAAGPEVIDADYISNVVDQRKLTHNNSEQQEDNHEGNGRQ